MIPCHKSKVFEVTIYEGPHFTDKIAKKYIATGYIDQVIEGARIECGQLLQTRNKRVWVDIAKDNMPIEQRIFCEGEAT